MKNKEIKIANIQLQYLDYLIQMYYWDKRSDIEPDNAIYCRIRNENATKASVLFDILSEAGFTQEDFEFMHTIAKAKAGIM